MLKLERVTKVYKVGTFGGEELIAVRDVSFEVRPGEVVSLIGESGSGKTTVGKMILRLTPVTSGAITVDGVDVAGLTRKKLKGYYATVQGVFQDPFSSYNPIFKVDHAFNLLRTEYFGGLSGPEWTRKVGDSLEAVGLEAGQVLRKYPHQLSGGQLQRLLVARALLLDIGYLVADEIISMLDASTRIDVLNLLGDLKGRGLGIVFITHDLSLGNYISEKTVILRRGSIVEMGLTDRVFGNPHHPYTKMLLASVPQLHRTWEEVAAELNAPAPPLVGEPRAGEMRQAPNGGARPVNASPALVEVEHDHFVAPFESNGHAS
jgi:oligopeptide/dipeptide ABC transporter ATP-binding protein